MPKRGRCLAQWATPVNPLATKADLRELELRVRLHLGAYVFAAGRLSDSRAHRLHGAAADSERRISGLSTGRPPQRRSQ